jgi:hypothetical protein
MNKIGTCLFVLLAIMVVLSSAYEKRGYKEIEEPKFSLRDILAAISESRMAARAQSLENPRRVVCFAINKLYNIFLIVGRRHTLLRFNNYYFFAFSFEKINIESI